MEDVHETTQGVFGYNGSYWKGVPKEGSDMFLTVITGVLDVATAAAAAFTLSDETLLTLHALVVVFIDDHIHRFLDELYAFLSFHET